MKIYALDDCGTFRMLYRHLLGADTYCTADGLLATMKLDKPDLFICDLVMPDMDGWIVINKVREMFPDLPIIVASTLCDFAQKQYAASLGCYYWCKDGLPSELKRLAEEIESCIQPDGK